METDSGRGRNNKLDAKMVFSHANNSATNTFHERGMKSNNYLNMTRQQSREYLPSDAGGN